MLQEEFVEQTKTEWVSSIVFEPKKDGLLNFCVNYRRLNAMTVRNSFFLPSMNECINFLGEARIFSALDASSGYWHVEIDAHDRSKTAFRSHHGLFQIVRMPVGLKNAPVKYQ